MTVWIDIEDLVRHINAGLRPSGIQRLSYEVVEALLLRSDDHVRVCRHSGRASGFVEIDWTLFRAKFAALVQEELPTVRSAMFSQEPPISSASRSSPLQRIFERLPQDIRRPLSSIYTTERVAYLSLKNSVTVQREAVRALNVFLENGWQYLHETRLPTRADRRLGLNTTRRPSLIQEGDILLSLGATWQFRDYAARVDKARAFGARFAILIYDMIPILFPEWSFASSGNEFQHWVETLLPRADFLFTISNATSDDVATYAARHGLTTPPAITIPIGATVSGCLDATAPPLHPRPYVLFVSTIEPRKNHLGALRIWRDLITRQSPERVPDLVLAGRVARLAHHVVAEAENANWFDGKVRLIEGPTDIDLATLYRDSLFTIYPSFYEGWGLPITESLCFGKTVAASDRASIPEAGGRFCRYFNPDNLNDAYRVISDLIYDPEQRSALEAEISGSFHPPSWQDSAELIMRAFGAENAAPTDVSFGGTDDLSCDLRADRLARRSSP